MKAAVVCMLIAYVVVMTSSQPTYDLDRLQSECGCQQSDEKLEITVNSLKNQVAAMKDELQQLRQQLPPIPETPGTSGPGVTYGPPIRHAACPMNFTYVQSVRGCYYVVVEKLHEDDASSRCVALHPDAHLVVITSAQEQAALDRLLYPTLAVRYAWTAGRRVNATNFAWRVVTSKSYEVLPMHFTSWNAGQPNNQMGLDFCVILHRNYNFKWVDAVCGNTFSAVCEIDIA